VKQNRWAIAVGALLVVAAIVLGGCGGSGGSGSQGKRLTRAEFATKTDAICSAYRKKAKTLGHPSGGAESVRALGKVKVLFGAMVADVKKLKPPADEQATVDRALTISKEQLGMLDQMIAALERNDTAYLLKLVKKGDAMDKESNRVYHRLGVKACA
jgi:hypothetical protein